MLQSRGGKEAYKMVLIPALDKVRGDTLPYHVSFPFKDIVLKGPAVTSWDVRIALTI